MHLATYLSIFTIFPAATLAETVLGVYIFSRHGDRTAKALGSTHLTQLGYEEIFASGTYYRNRYVAANATNKISGISTDEVKLSQILAQSPYDAVLMPSAQGFLQGLYPPVGNPQFTLANGTNGSTPLNGFQIIPVQSLSTDANSENSAWLQGQSNCANALASSNQYLSSAHFVALSNTTSAFYKNLTSLTNGTFSESQMGFKNAYAIFDLFNVAKIHNTTFDPQEVLRTNDNFLQLQTLADTHEFNLAYNASSTIRAIAGATLASEIVTALNQTVMSFSAPRINVQFGAYASFQSFFGLANLTMVNPDFFGIPDYASSMTFELVTNSSSNTAPKPEEVGVRFYFHNGTMSDSSILASYPLFGQREKILNWNDFVTGMNKFAIYQNGWCEACGNTTGLCASGNGQAFGSSDTNAQAEGPASHLSNAVAGLIGAMVTLGVILGLELLVLFVGNLQVVSKKRLNVLDSEGSMPVKA